jgi:hypothetical protein
VIQEKLPESGRSAPAIIGLANSLISWSLSHPIEAYSTEGSTDDAIHRAIGKRNPENQATTLQLYVEREMTP